MRVAVIARRRRRATAKPGGVVAGEAARVKTETQKSKATTPPLYGKGMLANTGPPESPRRRPGSQRCSMAAPPSANPSPAVPIAPQNNHRLRVSRVIAASEIATWVAVMACAQR